MNDAELQRIVTMHELWIASDGDDGRQANLSGVELNGHDLTGVNLSGANLSRATFVGVSLFYSYLTSANLEGATLEKTDLTGANLVKANLTKASLWDVGLSKSDLSEAILHEGCFHFVNLIGASLFKTTMWKLYALDTDFTRAFLEKAFIDDANLSGCIMEAAWLVDASLLNAKLSRVSFEGAQLDGAAMAGADLSNCNFTEAHLRGSSLRSADLREADFNRANLQEADLESADLRDADFTDANLQGANLRDVKRSNAIFDGAKLGYTILDRGRKPEKRVAFARKRKVVKGLREVTEPMQVAAFKKAFPQAFDVIKRELGGGTLDPQKARDLIASYGLVWTVTKGIYTSGIQRVAPEPNEVLRMNVDVDLLTDDRSIRCVLHAIRHLTDRADHPVERDTLFTIGWIRYFIFADVRTLLIEEIQSDVATVRDAGDESYLRERLEKAGFEPERTEKAFELLRPFVERFYQDALSLIFDVAEELGLTVEMLSYYQHKIGWGAPPHVYETLPRSMGMKKTADFKSPIEARKLWQIKPNPSRGRSGTIPDTFLWRRA